MAWWQILVGILLFIVALGVLIGIHELGHLGAAKMFKVYCLNYSIGFGPKIISSKRTKKHETIWTLRAIPLGGFVSMYGEGVDLDTDEYIPPSRSLEGIARYKRAVIISAGVFLNFVLGFVLITLHNGCFPHISFDFPSHLNSSSVYETAMVCSFNDTLKEEGLVDGDEMKIQMDPFAGVFLIDSEVTFNENNYVVCMSNVVTTTKIDPLMSDSIVIYGQKTLEKLGEEAVAAGYSDNRLVSFIMANNKDITKEEAFDQIKDKTKTEKDERYKDEINNYYTKRGYEHAPDLNNQYNVSNLTPDIEIDVTFYHEDTIMPKEITLKNNGGSGFKDVGVHLKRHFTQYNFQQTMSASWDEWCNANTAVFRGIGMLFTGQGEVSGPIGIAKMSTTVLANFGFERYLYLWGMISCNLAILNLLPFPGLDGWALVVIGYEAITKKQIPTKVKGIISVIGLGLLFLLMIFIIIKDIMGLII